MSVYRPWNFQCWQDTDWGAYEEDTGGYNRGHHGGSCVSGRKMGWRYNDPGNSEWNLWFTNYGTLILPFLIRGNEWSGSTGRVQYLFTVGVGGDAQISFQVFVVHNAVGDSKLHVRIWDRNTSTWRFVGEFGDEDGVNWLSVDKWYQIAISISQTAIYVGLNGTLSPTQNVAINAPGTLNWSRPIESGVGEMIAIPGTHVNSSSTNFLIFWTEYWSTCVRGPLALDTVALDLSQESVRNRIWDAQGNLKFPGENASMWFQDDYDPDAASPRLYWPDGSGRWARGSDQGQWTPVDAGSSGSYNHAGGHRKQYEATS